MGRWRVYERDPEDADPALFALLGLRVAPGTHKSPDALVGHGVNTEMRLSSTSGPSEVPGQGDLAPKREKRGGHRSGDHGCQSNRRGGDMQRKRGQAKK